MIRQAWIGVHADVTQKRQCVLAGVSRTTVYVKRKQVVFVEVDEVLKRLIDEEYRPVPKIVTLLAWPTAPHSRVQGHVFRLVVAVRLLPC